MRVQINTYNSLRGMGDFQVETTEESLCEAIYDRNVNRVTELALFTAEEEVSIVVPWNEVILIMPLAEEAKDGSSAA